jgi:capsular polysaccharide transport system permease protein
MGSPGCWSPASASTPLPEPAGHQMIRDEIRTLGRALVVEKRVIGALFMRELVTRWGRRNFGFAWLFAEPLVFALPVIGMWSLIRSPFEHGLPMIAFVWSGYLPLLIFRHVTGRALYVVRSNAAMLYHQPVTPFDLFIGCQGLELIGNIAACAMSFLLLHMIGVIEWPQDYALTLIGFFYMSWWAIAVALNIAALSERYEIVEHIWLPTSYMYMTVCGFLFLAAWLPAPLRRVALAVDPPLHAYEMIRAGLFGNRIQTFYDIAYLTWLLAIITLIGLWQMRHVRKYIILG